jgi:hypothetical protein
VANPVLLLSALQDGILEEVLVVGYLLSRLRLLGVSPARAVAIAAVCAAPTTCTKESARSSAM